MFIDKIALWHFRNYTNATFSFSPQVNLIKGQNAQGKTNLLEAIYFLSTGRSFRTSHLFDLVPTNEPFFYLEANFVKDGVTQSLKASFDGQVRKLTYNETPFSSFSSLLGLLPIVLIAPQDLALITGAPLERRRLLDLLLAQSDPLYVHHLGRYHKAVKQRNALLKQKREESLEIWERSLAISAAYLLEKRRDSLAELVPLAQRYLHTLTEGDDALEIRYQPTSPSMADEIFAAMQKNRRKELIYGSTLIGPHRDDLQILLGKNPAKNFASEGQKRGIVTALRLAEWERLKRATGYTPLLGIDDFGVHLDEKRYALIQRCVEGLGQVFLTTPSPISPVSGAYATILIEAGKSV